MTVPVNRAYPVKDARQTEVTCPHCGHKLGDAWTFTVGEPITVPAGQPIPLGVTAAAGGATDISLPPSAVAPFFFDGEHKR